MLATGHTVILLLTSDLSTGIVNLVKYCLFLWCELGGMSLIILHGC